MNPLRGPNGIPPQMMQGIQQVKSFMQTPNNTPLQQVMQLCNGRNPQAVFQEMCQQQGIDPDAFIKALMG